MLLLVSRILLGLFRLPNRLDLTEIHQATILTGPGDRFFWTSLALPLASFHMRLARFFGVCRDLRHRIAPIAAAAATMPATMAPRLILPADLVLPGLVLSVGQLIAALDSSERLLRLP